MPQPSGLIAPALTLPALNRPDFNFNSMAGRPVVLVFFDHLPDPLLQAQVQQVLHHRHRFDDTFASLFLVFRERGDAARVGITRHEKGLRCFFDEQQLAARTFDIRAHQDAPMAYPAVVTFDRHLRVMSTVLGSAALDSLPALLDEIQTYHEHRARSTSLGMAPILVIDRVLEPSLCEALIDYYHRNGGQPSGVMRDVAGQTRGFFDDGFKKRFDCVLKDNTLRQAVVSAIGWRVRPLIRQAFHFDASRIERHIVTCYDAEDGGFFLPHRDNGGVATQHRRFAVTLNLNAEGYDGGDLYFPEFGEQTYRGPTGGAIVFSGSLLHGVTRVTRGTRYACLPFLYGADDQVRRDANRDKIVDGVIPVGYERVTGAQEPGGDAQVPTPA